MNTQAIIFDLDGVIVSTDELHYQAWRALADKIDLSFTRHDNERLRGVSRMESLEIMLEKWNGTPFSDEEKNRMAEEKNEIYRKSLAHLTPADILPGVVETLDQLKRRGIAVAIGSSSKNASAILEGIGLAEQFNVVVDGTHISKSKPDPEVFLLASARLNIEAARCMVVEDAEAGIEAAVRAGMPVLAVGPARNHPKATLGAANLADITVDEILAHG